jgi:hypothetical protein
MSKRARSVRSVGPSGPILTLNENRDEQSDEYPICDYCGLPIEEQPQQCAARHSGACAESILSELDGGDRR